MRRAACLLVLIGCVGEASVSYQGVVVVGERRHWFAPSPDPAGLAPVTGANVEILIDGNGGTSVTTNERGEYPELDTVFGGFAGDKVHIMVRATAPSGARTDYSMIFEDTTDPTVANPSCKTPCPPVYLNFAIP